MDSNRINELLAKLNQNQKRLFIQNIELWEKITALNGRPQNFDSFETDESLLINEWRLFFNEILIIEFDETLKV